jgi:hypothetical protein
MAHTFRARILAFHGSWLSGLATLVVLLANGETHSIYCENAPTVRALDACFGNIIRRDHTVAIPAALRDREVVLSVDGMGLLLAFTPVEDWPGPDVPDEGIWE